MEFVLDSSVIVAAILQTEPNHAGARRLWDRLTAGEHHASAPATVLVEVVSAIRRRTGSERDAREAGERLQAIPDLQFIAMTRGRVLKAVAIAIQTGLRGMDALVAQVARERGLPLVSLDRDFTERAGALVSVLAVGEV